MIQFDFATLNTPEAVGELYAKLDTIQEDVCILANNTGKGHANPIEAHTVDMCFNMVNVNINAMLFISRYFIPKFKARFAKAGKRSAVINVSSISALGASASTVVYGSTKAFNRMFSLGMEQECKEFLDVLTVLPASTKSSMNSGRYLGTITAP